MLAQRGTDPVLSYLQRAFASTRTLAGTEVRCPLLQQPALAGATTRSRRSPGRLAVQPRLYRLYHSPLPPRTSPDPPHRCDHRLPTTTTDFRLQVGRRCRNIISKRRKVASHRIRGCLFHHLADCHHRLRCAADPHRQCIPASRLARRTVRYLGRQAWARPARIDQRHRPIRSRQKAIR